MANISSDDEPTRHRATNPIICGICDKQFSRNEHLLRHSQIHSREKPIECGYCGKTFGRKDSAKRHEQLHAREARIEAGLARSATLCRTCSTCAKSRIKCSGGLPCNHCATRSLDCVYLPRKRKRPHFQQGQEPIAKAQGTTEDLACDTGHSSGDDGLGETTTGCSQGTQRDGFSHHETDAGVVRRDKPEITFETEPVQSQTSPSFTNEIVAMTPQWPEEPVATNWLPFDGSTNGYFIFPSPENDLQIQPGEIPQFPTSAICDPTTETLDKDRTAQGFDGFSLQHDRVSALINSMGGGLHDYTKQPSASSPSVSTPSSAQKNILYADGVGFRSSQADRCIRARQTTYGTYLSPDHHHEGNSWLEILTSKVQSLEEHRDPRFDIPEDIFQDLLSKLRPPAGEQLLSEEFLIHEAVLLSRPTLSFLLRLYFDNFHKLYPFVDRSFISIPIWGWSLTLAAAAIGTRYLGLTKLTMFGDELCGILHDLLLRELHFGRIQDSLPYIQARLLAAICMCQSSQPHLLNCGYSALALVTNSCLYLRLLEEDDRVGAYQEDRSLEQTWIAWRFRETRRRTGLLIWLTDCLLAFVVENPPSLPSRRLKLRLPCPEDFWEAESAQGWLALVSKENTNDGRAAFQVEESTRPTVQEAADKLRRDLCTPESVTQFGTIIILQMLLRRRWDAQNYLMDTISTSGPRTSQRSDPSRHRYIGEIPEYIRWRNYTCDCLDLLHWEALSASNKAGGFEGPIFLQLHSARLVILAPVQELLDHLSTAIQPGASQLLPHNLYRSPDPDLKWRRTLFTWAHQDRFKARLAVIHAGAVLWHTRRYSTASFIEPYTIFLATLVLWAFGMAPQVIQKQLSARTEDPIARQLQGSEGTVSFQLAPSNLAPNSEPGEELVSNSPSLYHGPSLNGRRMPRLMQLDRPMDDELVQHFIRSGEGMRLYLEGVDDLCSDQGPIEVLHEGVTLLRGELSRTWTIAESYASTLVALASAGS